MSKRILALLLALAMIVGVFAACGDSGNNSSSGGNSSTASTGGDSNDGNGSEPSNVSTGPDDTSEPYTFKLYYYYSWQQMKKWGADNFSKYMGELFNVNIEFDKPDADEDSKLQIMLTGGDLPDAMVLDRGRVLKNAVQANALVEIEQFMYPGCTFENDIGEATRELLKVEGKLYGVPNWGRGPGKTCTGGNEQWMVNTAVYEAAGKPALNTLNDLHDYAVKAKELADGGMTSYSGMNLIPFAATNEGNGFRLTKGFFRSLGGANLVETYFTQENATLDLGINNDLYIEALRQINSWYREGLWSMDIFSDNGDQWVEKMTNGRPALMFYDFSQDDGNNFRRLARANSNETVSYEVVGDPSYADLASFPQYPPADGVTVTYGDENGTPGWNVNVITTKAARPQRIFDLFTWMISEEGSKYQVLGGPDGPIWNGEFDSDGNAILNIDYGDITGEEQDAAGAWLWTQPAHSDYVDTFKFGLNDRATSKNWVVSIQANLCSYNEEDPKVGQKIKSDQCTGLNDVIESTSDLGIALKSIQDQCAAELPKIMAAESDDEFNTLVANLQKYAADHQLADILTEWQAKYDANIASQGYDVYSAEYDVYGLNK